MKHLLFSILLLPFISLAENTPNAKEDRTPAQQKRFQQTAIGTMDDRSTIYRIIDTEQNVVCYIAGRGGTDSGAAIHCLPVIPK